MMMSKKFISFFMIIMICIVFFVGMIFFIGFSGEVEERYYEDFKALNASGEPGNWVPMSLPDSSLDIRIKYKIDTGEQLVSFHFYDENNFHIINQCEKITLEYIQFPQNGFLNVDWWPNSLYEEIAKNDDRYEYVFYLCDRHGFLALREIHGKVYGYYWRISR